MSAGEEPGGAAEQGRRRDDAAREAARRRLAEALGDVLPETTGDERDSWGEPDGGRDPDDWLRSQVPPHHG